MGLPSSETSPSAKVSEGRLDSWKEIAAYLNRDVTTAQRWEKREGMPVHRHVHDKRGSVYALASELDAWLATRRLLLAEDEQERELEPVAPAQPAVPRTVSRGRLWLALAGLAALAVLTIAYITSRGQADRAAAPKIRSLAVLPLKNLSGDPGQEYLADGLTDALIGRLAGIHDLRVISRTSVMRFKNLQISVPEIARTLGVDAVVEGSVTREGNRIRVTAQLIRGSTDAHFWSETYDRQFRDVLSLESDVAQTVAEKIEVMLTGEERKRITAARTVSPEAYESYLQGLFELYRSPSRGNLDKSLRYFQDAIARDPTFAPAYVGLAYAYRQLGSNFVGEPPNAAIQNEFSAARKALELDPSLSDAHDVMAGVAQQRWQWADAESEYKLALALNPNDALAHGGLAWWFLCQGRADEGLAWARRARELDPLVIQGPELGWMLFEARRYDEAERELRSTLAVQPDDALALWDLGIVLIDKNQAKDAIPVLEKAVSLSERSPGVTGTMIGAYARAGRRADALRLLARLQRRRKSGFLPAGPFVKAYLALGEYDQAFAWLEEAYKEHSNVLQFLKVDPDFDPIRRDPRFASLLQRVGLA